MSREQRHKRVIFNERGCRNVVVKPRGAGAILRNCKRKSARLCHEVSFSVYVSLDVFLGYYKGLTCLEGADYVS